MNRMDRELNYNLKIIMDFEEELGSPNLTNAVKKYFLSQRSNSIAM